MPPTRPQAATQPRRERLASLKVPSQLRRSSTPQRPTSNRNNCPNPSCKTPDIQEHDGNRVCVSCGTLISDSQIVSEVTFGETSAGAAVVQGGFVGEGQRHAKSLGTAFRRAGGGESREAIEHSARTEIRQQAWQLRLPNTIEEQAFQIYRLAAANNFMQGRRVRTVISICLYIACRRSPQNTTLFMDFSELIQVNVFHLGAVYQDMLKDLWLGSFANSGVIPVMEPEPLIMKFARKLEFGNSTDKVAEDAVRIIKRMKRDWMVTGRRPSGLCGACIILAARMNNFRRTVREVVYVVKVTDATIVKRLAEFQRTTSGGLTVEQFRSYGLRLKRSHDPPALYEAQERERKRRKKAAQTASEEPMVISDSENGGEDGENGASTQQQQTKRGKKGVSTKKNSKGRSQKARRDADGFVIPELPINRTLPEATNAAHAEPVASEQPRASSSSAQTSVDIDAISDGNATNNSNASSQSHVSDSQTSSRAGRQLKRKRGRPNAAPSATDSTDTSSQSAADASESSSDADEEPKRKRGRPKAGPPPVITPEDLLVEGELENEIETILNDPEALANMEETAFLASQARAKALADTMRSASNGNSTTTRHAIPETIEIGSDEFDSDPEVRNCLLSPAEIRVKERIWVTHNEDWLRSQQARILKREVEEAAGRGNKDKAKRKRRRGRLGDGSVLEGDTPVRTPAEANMRMLARRGKGFSRHINYEKLQEIYAGSVGTSRGGAGSGSAGAGTPSESVAAEAEEGEEAASESGAGAEAPGETTLVPKQQKRRATKAADQEEADEEEDVLEEYDDDAAPKSTSTPLQQKAAPAEDELNDEEDEDEDEAEEEDAEENGEEDAERETFRQLSPEMGEDEVSDGG